MKMEIVKDKEYVQSLEYMKFSSKMKTVFVLYLRPMIPYTSPSGEKFQALLESLCSIFQNKAIHFD